jgi:hypothetical protein
LGQKLPKPGILLAQRTNFALMLVVPFFATTRWLILAKGIFKQRKNVVDRLNSPK